MVVCWSLSSQDINELKVFVDLASISAGENDIDVDRVACFHDAVQGYASLLYKMDERTNFSDFMNHLQELWRALDNDQHLPDKLVSLLRTQGRLSVIGTTITDPKGFGKAATAIPASWQSPIVRGNVCSLLSQEVIYRMACWVSASGKDSWKDHAYEKLTCKWQPITQLSFLHWSSSEIVNGH